MSAQRGGVKRSNERERERERERKGGTERERARARERKCVCVYVGQEETKAQALVCSAKEMYVSVLSFRNMFPQRVVCFRHEAPNLV